MLVMEAIKDLGADPTAVTPGADVDGVASIGLMQVMTDPRTSIAQSLHVLLIAELADHDGWQLLIKLAEELGQNDMAGKFRGALAEEGQHLTTIREFVEKSCMSEAGVS